MTSKLKIAAITLSTLFAIAAAPMAIIVETTLEAKKIGARAQHDMFQLNRQRHYKSHEEILIVNARTHAFLNCMDENALRSLGIARTSKIWGDRLSFWPAASSHLYKMAEVAHMRGLVQGHFCARRIDLMPPPAPLV